MKQVLISFDVGGTNIKASLIATSGRVLVSSFEPTKNNLGKNKIIEEVICLADDLLVGQVRLKGVALAWPSTVNLSLSGQEMKNILQKKFKVPVILENDANVFTLAEAKLGQGKKYKVVVGLTLGTGVGCGLVIDKKIYHGAGQASEFGHVSLNFSGPKCACGNYGCFEEFAGSRAIERLAKKYKFKNKTGQDLYELAIQGDKRATKLWQEFGKQLAWGIISVINALDPEIVVVGGQISKAWKFFYPAMQAEVDSKVMFKKTPIKVSKLENAGTLGAALLFK